MTRHLTAKSYYFFIFLAIGIVLAVFTERIELLAITAPFTVAVVRAYSRVEVPRYEAVRDVETTRVFESDTIVWKLDIDASSPLPLVEVLEPLPEDAVIRKGSNLVIVSLDEGERRELRCELGLPTRRRMQLERAMIRVFDRAGFYYYERSIEGRIPVVVFPNPEQLRSLVRPIHTQVYTGNFPSRSYGEGLEFASLRPMQHGDRVARINWRATARRGELHVNEYTSEKNADILILLDTFADAGSSETTFLDLGARCAATISRYYLQDKNRVGLIELGNDLSFVTPTTGGRQWYRILEHLAGAAYVQRYVSRDIGSVPSRILSSRALIIAITSLIADEFIHALFVLKQRGFDVITIYVSSFELLEEWTGIKDRRARRVALELYRREQNRRVDMLLDSGIAIVPWSREQPLDVVLRRVNALRRV